MDSLSNPSSLQNQVGKFLFYMYVGSEMIESPTSHMDISLNWCQRQHSKHLSAKKEDKSIIYLVGMVDKLWLCCMRLHRWMYSYNFSVNLNLLTLSMHISLKPQRMCQNYLENYSCNLPFSPEWKKSLFLWISEIGAHNCLSS